MEEGVDGPLTAEPEVRDLSQFLAIFNTESDRGAALVAASMLDERLSAMLKAFFVDSKVSKELLEGFNAPLGTLSARAAAAYALGLLQEHEFKEISLVRKIRNEFGHSWLKLDFDTAAIARLALQLPWLGPKEFEVGSGPRARFNAAVEILLVDLLWRERLVAGERRCLKAWPNTTGMPRS